MTPAELLALAERLAAILYLRKMVPTIHGQMVGLETYRIEATGFQLEAIAEAATALEQIAKQEPVATVINNNQPGWTNIIETAPNVTLDVGMKLYAAPPAGEAKELRRIRELLIKALCRATGDSRDAIEDAPLTRAIAHANEHAAAERRAEQAEALLREIDQYGVLSAGMKKRIRAFIGEKG